MRLRKSFLPPQESFTFVPEGSQPTAIGQPLGNVPSSREPSRRSGVRSQNPICRPTLKPDSRSKSTLTVRVVAHGQSHVPYVRHPKTVWRFAGSVTSSPIQNQPNELRKPAPSPMSVNDTR
jgi:hypothetical protein